VTREGIEFGALAAQPTSPTRRASSPSGGERIGGRPRLGPGLVPHPVAGLGKAAKNKPHWSLALDDALFSVPFAALVVDGAPDRPVYLAERHAVRLSPVRTYRELARRPFPARQRDRRGLRRPGGPGLQHCRSALETKPGERGWDSG